MPTKRTGSVRCREAVEDGESVIRHYARVSYTDDSGKRHFFEKRAKNESHARQIIGEKFKELDEKGALRERMTFNDLCDYYEQNYLFEAVYSGGRKVAGIRQPGTYRSNLKPLRDYFGQRRAGTLTYDDLLRYKEDRLKTSAMRGRARHSEGLNRDSLVEPHTRSLASVNRELSLARRMFSIAQSEGWITRDPFRGPTPLISVADEVRRGRVLNVEEEDLLLKACSLSPWQSLRAFVICALDTGLRRGEIAKLAWSDLNLRAWGLCKSQTARDHIAFSIQESTKTQRVIESPITARLEAELKKIWEEQDRPHVGRIFTLAASSASRYFDLARDSAGLPGLRFQDLRHTHSARLNDLKFTQALSGNEQKNKEAERRREQLEADKAEFERVVRNLGSKLQPHKIKRPVIAAEYDRLRKTKEALDPSTITKIVLRCYGQGTSVADAVALVLSQNRESM